MSNCLNEQRSKAIEGFSISFKPTEIPGKNGEYYKVYANGEELGTVRRSGRGSATRYQVLNSELYAESLEGRLMYFYPKDEVVAGMLKGMVNRNLLDDPLYKAQLESKKVKLTSELLDLSEKIQALSYETEMICNQFNESHIDGSIDVWSAMRYLDAAASELKEVAMEISTDDEVGVA